jgi:hypothetical protein
MTYPQEGTNLSPEEEALLEATLLAQGFELVSDDDDPPPPVVLPQVVQPQVVPPPVVPPPVVPPPVVCLECETEVWDPAGLPLEPTVRCSWSGCLSYSSPYHVRCVSPADPCPVCHINMPVVVTRRDDHPQQRVQRLFAVHANSTMWSPAHGVPQTGMLCYAAAAATACQCAGVQITLLECMHMYAYSGANEHRWAEEYKQEFDNSKRTLIGSGNPNPSVDDILQSISGRRPQLYSTVMGGTGSPMFPPAMSGRVEHPRATISSAELFSLINQNKLVMAGDSTHWLVIYACYGSAQDSIDFIEFWDPGGSGGVSTKAWRPRTYTQYLVVN